MSALHQLRECACGHVANHHSRANGCHVAGCLCRAFDGQHVSRERHAEVIREANRRIARLRKERDEARAAIESGRRTDG